MGIIEVWISEGSGWTIDRVDNNYTNVVNYKPLNGSSYIELPTELKNSAKGLINIKNKDDECFRWCHIRHLNPQSKDPQRIKKAEKQYIDKLDYSNIISPELKNSAKGLINIKNKDDECFRWCHIRHLNPQSKDPQRIKKAEKQYIDKLDYSNIISPVSQKQYNKIEKQNSIRINVFGYEEEQRFTIHISKEKFEDQMNLPLMTKDEKRHYVLIKDFNKFMYNQSKYGERKHFCMCCL